MSEILDNSHGKSEDSPVFANKEEVDDEDLNLYLQESFLKKSCKNLKQKEDYPKIGEERFI
jgi:hypothetical protein